jgi:hypothetical protein
MYKKTKEKNYDWLYGIGFFVMLGILGQCLSLTDKTSNVIPASTYPTYPPSSSSGSKYEGYSLTAQVELTQDAQDEQILIWEYRETQTVAAYSNLSGCPDGCIVHTNGCDIKGNISFDTGAKIYHMLGQEYYNSTTIDINYGERWFCTEAEAIANGWRKSYQ